MLSFCRPGERTRVGCTDSPEGLECGPGHNEGCAQDGAQVCHKNPIVKLHMKGGVGSRHSSPILSMLTAGAALPLSPGSMQAPVDCAYMEAGLKSEPIPHNCANFWDLRLQ